MPALRPNIVPLANTGGVYLLSPTPCTQGAFDKSRCSPFPAQVFLRNDRVKSVDFHPTRTVAHHWTIPWLSEHVQPPNGTIVKTFEVSQVPVRCVRFIHRKNSYVTASDDFQLRVFNDNTHDKVVAFEAHPDYIRCLPSPRLHRQRRHDHQILGLGQELEMRQRE